MIVRPCKLCIRRARLYCNRREIAEKRHAVLGVHERFAPVVLDFVFFVLCFDAAKFVRNGDLCLGLPRVSSPDFPCYNLTAALQPERRDHNRSP